mmetsp:Transcript_57349/g.124650  ORF Transcript_57349/g.124650 Transcript_57349/m.124650 type:complete len:258 (+) Transcript_57349:1-774(+)
MASVGDEDDEEPCAFTMDEILRSFEAKVRCLREGVGQVKAAAAAISSDPNKALEVELMSDVIDDLCLDVALDVHQQAKLGLLCDSHLDSGRQGKPIHMKPTGQCGVQGIFVKPGFDVFGLQPSKTPMDTFKCDHCARAVVACKYAQHLAKCMNKNSRSTRSQYATQPIPFPTALPFNDSPPKPPSFDKADDGLFEDEDDEEDDPRDASFGSRLRAKGKAKGNKLGKRKGRRHSNSSPSLSSLSEPWVTDLPDDMELS